MYNKDVFEKMSEKFGTEAMPQICKTFTYLFELGREDAQQRKLFNDLDYDRQWWQGKYNELTFRAEDCNKSDDLSL